MCRMKTSNINVEFLNSVSSQINVRYFIIMNFLNMHEKGTCVYTVRLIKGRVCEYRITELVKNEIFNGISVVAGSRLNND